MIPWPNPSSLIYIPYPRANLLKTFTAAHTYIAHIRQYCLFPPHGGINAGSGTLLKECCFRVRVRVRLGGCQWNAGSGSWVEPEPGSGSIFFCKECCFRVRVMGDVQMSNRLKLKIARCGIQNPGRFCLWNRKSWTLELLFLFFIYLFIFWIFGTQTNTLS